MSARQFTQLLCLLSSLADVVPLGRLHIRPMQFYLFEHWIPAPQDWETPMHSSTRDAKVSTNLVDTLGERAGGNAPSTRFFQFDTFYRFVQSRLRCSSGRSNCVRPVISSTSERTHQFSRNKKTVFLALSHFRESLLLYQQTIPQ